MEDIELIDRLAKTAAEKHARNYWGNPYGGYPGGGFMMGGNPYMGGMRGGYPMEAERFGPWGHSRYGMDPRFAGQYAEQLGIGNQYLREGLPGVGVGLRGQQAGVIGQEQDVAAQSPLGRAGEKILQQSIPPVVAGDFSKDPRIAESTKATAEMAELQKQKNEYLKERNLIATQEQAAKNLASTTQGIANTGMGFSRLQLARARQQARGEAPGLWSDLASALSFGAGGGDAATAFAAEQALPAAQEKARVGRSALDEQEAAVNERVSRAQAQQQQSDMLAKQVASDRAAVEEANRARTQRLSQIHEQTLPYAKNVSEATTGRLNVPTQPGKPPMPITSKPPINVAPPPTVPPPTIAKTPPRIPPPVGPGGPALRKQGAAAFRKHAQVPLVGLNPHPVPMIGLNALGSPTPASATAAAPAPAGGGWWGNALSAAKKAPGYVASSPGRLLGHTMSAHPGWATAGLLAAPLAYYGLSNLAGEDEK